MKHHASKGAEKIAVPVHPLGIKPLGNAYTSNQNIKTRAGLFALLPDELITQVLEWFEPTSLLGLGSTCKTLYAFCRQEDLWKTLLLRYEDFFSEKNYLDLLRFRHIDVTNSRGKLEEFY